MFINSMWDIKEPTHYSKRVGHEVPGVVAVFCECMGRYGEVIYLAWDIVSFVYHLALLSKTGQKQVWLIKKTLNPKEMAAFFMSDLKCHIYNLKCFLEVVQFKMFTFSFCC